MSYFKLNNGTIGNIVSLSSEDRKALDNKTFKSMVTLSPEIRNNPSKYFDVMDKIFNATNPLPEGKMPEITMRWLPDEIPNQIETNLEPQELLSALWSSGLITHDEMMAAYKEMELTPQTRTTGNGLSPMETPPIDNNPVKQPSFSLF